MTTTLDDRIDLPEAPAIDGLVFRHFRGAEDYPGMVAANMAAREAAGIQEVVSVAGLASGYANPTNWDPATDLVIVELDGRIVGYTRVQWDDQADGSRAYDTVCIVHPDVRRQGIGRALLAWDERRNREIAAGHPPDGRPRWLQAWGWDADEGAAHLLRGAGYEPVRRGYEMVRPTLDDIPDAPLPDGLEIRPVDRADMRRIWEADNEIFRDHWGEIDESEAHWRRFRDDPRYDPSLFVVAFEGDALAGMVINLIDPEDTARTGQVRGLLDGVGVRRAWRRRGLARALIVRSLHLLRDRGATAAYLGVDAENPNQAMTLYESTGFAIASSETAWRKPLETR